MFSEILVKEGFKIAFATNDADFLIARTALSYSKEKQVKVIAEDADILVRLRHYVNEDVHQVMLQFESRTWNIQYLVDKTGHRKVAILLIHAFLGYDKVSRIYDTDKDKITRSPKLVNIRCDIAPVFYHHLFSKLDMQEAGEKLLLGLYNRVNIGSLNKLRHKIFMEKIAGKSLVKPE